MNILGQVFTLKFRKDLTILLVHLFVFCLFFKQHYSTIFLFIALVINFDKIITKTGCNNKDLKLILFISTPLILSILWTFRSSHIEESINMIERSLGFLFISWFVFCIIEERTLKGLFFTVLFSAFLSLLVLPFGMKYNYYLFHKSYIGLYYLFVITGCFFYIKNKLVSLALSTILFFGILLTTARMPILLGALLLFFISIFIFSKFKFGFFYKFIGVVSIISLVVALFFFNHNLYTRFEKLTSPKVDFIRYRNWNSSFKAFLENPILGSGSGDALYVVQKYRDPQWLEYMNNYNSHNQYLDYLLKYGIVGLFAFLTSIVMVIFYLYRFKLWPVILIVFIALLEGIVEVIFSLRAGVFGYVFFVSFYIRLFRQHE